MRRNVWRRVLAVMLAAVMAAGVLSACAARKEDDAVVLQLRDSAFTGSQVLAKMELTCRKYNLTLDDLREDPTMWNKLAEDVAYEYAGAEIVTDLAQEYGFDQLSAEEEAQAQAQYDSFLADIENIGEDATSFLNRLGLTEEGLMALSRARLYQEKVTALWAEDLELSDEEGMANYQILLNYMKRISEQIDERIASGLYARDLSSLLLPVEEE